MKNVLHEHSFRNKGKTKALNMVEKSKPFQQAFAHMGSSWTLSEQMEDSLEGLVCQLYGERHCRDIDEVWYSLFCRDLRAEQSPPNKGLPPTPHPTGKLPGKAYTRSA